MRLEFTAGPDDHDRRLETVLRRLCPGQSLGTLHKALRKGDIRLNGAKTGPEARVATGDTLAIWDVLTTVVPASSAAIPEFPSEWVLYEGQHWLVVNKPSGILVHRGDGPAPGGAEPPLDEQVRARLAKQSSNSLGFRPGPLHRLDRETSGVIVFSRTLIGARTFSEALATHRVKKTYLAVLAGNLVTSREVTLALSRDERGRKSLFSEDGQASETFFRPLAHSATLTLAEVTLGTGRTHQIRVHAQSLGNPLAGDQKYGGGGSPPGLDVPWLLHAWKLSCDLLPSITAPLPFGRAAWVEKTFKISL